jgi:lipopolysaccharide/colanic/teichoic acid biosynthesis glycosyltransferase
VLLIPVINIYFPVQTRTNSKGPPWYTQGRGGNDYNKKTCCQKSRVRLPFIICTAVEVIVQNPAMYQRIVSFCKFRSISSRRTKEETKTSSMTALVEPSSVHSIRQLGSF